ncbi:MAG: metalloregulator ArsR/SmtB family transcription factor [Cyanobacteriota bacterium]
MINPKYKKRAKFYKALAHPTRLFIIDQIAQQEKCVCELTEMVGVDISTISKHLSLLKNEGIVVEDKRGKNVYYTLKCPCILTLFDCVKDSLKEDG